MQQQYLVMYEHQLKHADGMLVDPNDVPPPTKARKGEPAGSNYNDEAALMALQVGVVAYGSWRFCLFLIKLLNRSSLVLACINRWRQACGGEQPHPLS